MGTSNVMLKREQWLPLARKLDWDYTYVDETVIFPTVASGRPWLPHSEWETWDEPYHTTYRDYVATQTDKEAAVAAVREAVGGIDDFRKLATPWLNALKLHSAILPLAEFAAVVGNLRAARFGRDSNWRMSCVFAALDEVRHTQIPLLLMHPLVHVDPQFDWAHKFYHTNNWLAIAARHFFDELLLAANPIEMAIASNFVFETGFTNLQFVGLSSLAHEAGDELFERMTNSIQSDEARHSQIGRPVLTRVLAHDPQYAQYLLDKWFWRSWLLFSTLTGISMDYLTPLEQRKHSFKEFMHEWVLDQYVRSLRELGMSKPWYWDSFVAALDSYHHMVYASAYTYRATLWFDLVAPGPAERAWLRSKYPAHWDDFDAVWRQIDERWKQADPGTEFAAHGTAIIGFCDLCQLPLCNGTPRCNEANTLDRHDKKYIFCSQPCRWIFESEPERYAGHKGVVARVLAGEAPANLLAMLTRYFGLRYEDWGRDIYGGDYAWLKRSPKRQHRDDGGGTGC
jgi:toluene monooxygenase system protein A